MSQTHVFEGALRWTGAIDEALDAFRHRRDYTLEFPGKEPLPGSAPAVFRGDDHRHNPESLMIASLMACHHLTYLALCERAAIRIVEYHDRARGTLGPRDGRTQMLEVRLQPVVRIADAAAVERARRLHELAHENCFMSRSVRFPVLVEPSVTA